MMRYEISFQQELSNSTFEYCEECYDVVNRYLSIWGNWIRCFQILIFHCMEISNQFRQDGCKTRYMAENPDKFILYPV
ncbi:SNARE associated Golgi protein family [Trifolium repens]|nr:SNARE associated Golgi protein family [Trifolium repens]